MLLSLGLLAGLALLFYAFWIEPRRIRVTRLSLPVEGLARPLRLLVMGDLQSTAPHETPERLAALAELASAQKPDIVLLVGDYACRGKLFSSGIVPPEVTARALASIPAPMGHFAVLGNHDWWWNGPRVRQIFSRAGITVLEDEARLAKSGTKALWVAGLRDAVTQGCNITAALAKTDGQAPVVLLSHTPDVFPAVPPDVALTLAGHTHGGQVCLPLIGAPVIPSRYGQRYRYGHVVEEGHHLYVTSGVGTSKLPLRFLAPPEIAVIDLMPQDSSAPAGVEFQELRAPTPANTKV